MKKQGLPVIFISMLYLALVSFLVGLRTEHLLILCIYNLCFFIGTKTRKFILAFTIFLVFGILYDLMKVYPNYMVNQVDISSLYHFEQSVFGFTWNGQFLTPNEFFNPIPYHLSRYFKRTVLHQLDTSPAGFCCIPLSN